MTLSHGQGLVLLCRGGHNLCALLLAPSLYQIHGSTVSLFGIYKNIKQKFNDDFYKIVTKISDLQSHQLPNKLKKVYVTLKIRQMK
jgi:hypothetical protein